MSDRAGARGGRALVAAVVVVAVVEASQVGEAAVAHGVPSPWVVTHVLALAAMAPAAARLRWCWSPVLTGAALLLAIRALSVLTAVDPQAALDATVGTARDMATLVVVLVLLATTGRYRLVVAACTAALALLAALTLVQQVVLGNGSDLGGLATLAGDAALGATTERHAGPVGDPNFWARVLVTFLPFAVALALAAPARARRLGWASAAASLLAGIWLTQSRGGMLAALAALVTLLAVAGSRYRRWLAVVPVVAVVLLVVPATGSRLATLAGTGGSDSGEESLLLRGRATETALRMTTEHPVLGVGLGNYREVAVEVEDDLDVAHLGRIEEGIAPHNAFLEAAAETGLPGLAVWLVFLGTIGFVAVRALLVTRPEPGGPASADHLLAAACVAGLAGWVVASAVLHVAQFRTLLVFAGIVAAVDLAGGRVAVPRARPAPAPARTRGRLRVLVGALVLLALAAVVAGRGAKHRWRGDSVVAVVPLQQRASALGAYEYDILSRPGVMRTMALVVGDPSGVRESVASVGLDPDDIAVRVDARATSGLLRVVVEGERRGDVAAALTAVTDQGVVAVNGLDTPFIASPVGEPSTREATEPRIDGRTWGLAGAAALTAWVLVAALVPRRGRPSSDRGAAA